MPLTGDPSAQPDLTPTDLVPIGLLTLLRSGDAVGALSIFVDATPRARGSAIDVRNHLMDLLRRVVIGSPPEVPRVLEAAVSRIQLDIEELLDPRVPGRGRALFAGLGGSPPIRFSGQLRSPAVGEQIRQRPGPVATTAGREQPTTPRREQRQRRARDHRLRVVDRVAGSAARLADEYD